MGEGPSLAEMRARLAELLAVRAGLEPHQVETRAREAEEDGELVESVVAALVDGGGFLHEEVGSRRVRLEDLRDLPVGQELLVVLDRRRSRPLTAAQRLRLGRLYVLAGEVEKAAVCWREVLAGPESPPLTLAIDLAVCAAEAEEPALALAGVDRVAEVVLTRDQGEGGLPPAQDPLRDDPLGAGALLERARDVALAVGHAPRAVALARAATALYERLGRRAEARHSLAGQSRALRAAGNHKKARQQLDRWRELAREVGATGEEAQALTLIAEQEAIEGQLQSAAALLEEAAQRQLAAGELGAGLGLVRRRARCLAEEGALERAAEVLEGAVLRAREGELNALAMDLALDLVAVQLDRGWIGPALAGSLALHELALAEGDGPRAAEALVLSARGQLQAGEPQGALAVLERLPSDIEPGPLAGRSLRIRAELCAHAGRGAEARLLLLDAARVLHIRPEARAEAIEALLRRVELLLEAGLTEAALEERRRVATLGVPPRFELRHELLAARLAGPEERELLLEELWEGSTAATQEDRARVAVALGRLRIEMDDRPGAADPLVDALEELREVQAGLPEPLRLGFADSLLARPLLAISRELAGTDAELDAAVAGLLEAKPPEPPPT